MLNFLKKLLGLVPNEDLQNAIAAGAFLVDVRSPGEFATMSIQGSINIPLSEVGKQLGKFKGKENIVVFCASGARSAQAASILRKNGIENVINGGGWQKVAKAIVM